MKKVLVAFCLQQAMVPFLASNYQHFEKYIHPAFKDTVPKTQQGILNLLHEKGVCLTTMRKGLSRDEKNYVRSLTMMLGFKSEQEGYLDPRAYRILDKLPKVMKKECIKSMHRTWLLDEEFCMNHLPVDVYAVSLEALNKTLIDNHRIRLDDGMKVSALQKPRCEREDLLGRISSCVTELPFQLIRTHKGKLFNRFDKRCTIDSLGYIEIPNLKVLSWQELLLLHQAALLNKSIGDQRSMIPEVGDTIRCIKKQYNNISLADKSLLSQPAITQSKVYKKDLFISRLDEILMSE